MSRLKVPTFASSGWGPWENRSHLRDDPRAPDGLQRAWLNRTYSVQLVARNGLEVLMIRRHDGQAHFPWTDLQKIKDQLVGEQREAVQVFPRKDEIVDSANMAHLWLVPDGERLPYTFARFSDVLDGEGASQ